MRSASWKTGRGVAINAAITGLGITALVRRGDTTAAEHAADAALLAVADAGIGPGTVDGLIVTHSPIVGCEQLGIHLHEQLGLSDLAVLQDIHAEGSSAMQMLHNAALYVSAGAATHVLCVFADTPIMPGLAGAGDAYAVAVPHGHLPGWEANHGLFGAAAPYALCARRHMTEFGTTEEHFGAVAVSARQWACGNPLAMVRKPITLADHRASPWVASPFRRLDCAFPVNGGIAIVVSRSAAAAECRRRPVYVAGIGQGHRANLHEAGSDVEVRTSAGMAADAALGMAGVERADIDVCELYDCFSYTTIVLMEDLGFCPKGEGGPFVADGHIARGGGIPTNTGGGQLSGYYMQGMTPISEAIIQLRQDGGERQVKGAELALVHGHGGILNYHACAVLSTSTPSYA
jgi:acetyl-CoA acetyltransferase